MTLSEHAVHRRVTTVMMYALICILGVVAIFKLPLEFMPQMDMPYIEVIVPYEGASPVEICERIAEPIEEAVATLPGIKKLRSRCNQGWAYIGMELSSSERIDYKVMDIQERIDILRQDLPADVRTIMINKFDTQQIPVIMGAVTFPVDKPENNELLERFLIRPLKTVEGVAEARLDGLEERRVLVEINQDRLSAYGINVLQVFDVLTSANLSLSAGTIDYKEKKHSVRIVGEFKDFEEIRNLPITSNVKVGDVAVVRMDYVRPFVVARLNGNRVFMLQVIKESGANTVQVCRNVNERLEEILAQPRFKGVKLKTFFDQSTEITTALDMLTHSGTQGAILAFLILLLFLKNIRSTLIISLSIPMSMLTTTAAMYFMNLSFNMITLSALIMSVGMLVDNSIVVLEAVDLYHRQGETPFQAAIKGVREVGLAISVSTTSTIIVFLPLIFTEQTEAALLMKQMGIVMSLAIGASLIVSLTLIPVFASRMLGDKHLGIPRWYLKFSDGFRRLLVRGLNRPFRTMAYMTGLFLFSVLLFLWPLPWDKIFPDLDIHPLVEKEAVPAAMMRIVRISPKFEGRPPFEEIDARMAELEKIFMAKKEEWDIDSVASIVSTQFCRLLLVLPDDHIPKYTSRQLQDMAGDFIKDNIHWAGVTFDTSPEQMGGGPPGMGGTSIKVRGPNAEQVFNFAELIHDRLIGTPGIKKLFPIERASEEEVHVMVDRDLARLYGFEVSQVAMAISYSIRGVPVGQIHAGDAPLDIYIQVEQADRKTLSQLESMAIQNVSGQYIPLKNIARFHNTPIPEQVRRDNRLITARVSFEQQGKDLGDLQKRIAARLRDIKLPMGYSWAVGEEFEEVKEDLMILAKAIFLAMILVFLVMTAQFESFFLPFVIMFELPFALIGVVAALIVGQSTFNVLSGAGCLLLVGVVVNNAIVLVDHIHGLRKQGMNDYDSLVQGSIDRLRPILMTALTTIVGLLPMALGFNDSSKMMYSPLALAVLGGLAFSTFLTPFVIPVIYSLSDKATARLRAGWRRLMAKV